MHSTPSLYQMKLVISASEGHTAKLAGSQVANMQENNYDQSNNPEIPCRCSVRCPWLSTQACRQLHWSLVQWHLSNSIHSLVVFHCNLC